MDILDGLKTRILKTLNAYEPNEDITVIEQPVSVSQLQMNYDDTLGRRENLNLYDRMESELPEFTDALDTLADLTIQGDDVLMRGHKVILEKLEDDYLHEKTILPSISKDDIVYSDSIKGDLVLHTKVDNIIKKFDKRTDLKHLLRNMTRESIKYGDFFAEILYGEDNITKEKYIVELIPLPIRQMELNRDKYGRLHKSKPYGITAEDEAEITYFDKNKVLRIQFGANFENKFGIGLAFSGRKSYARLDAMESAMVVKRMVRATMRYLFKIDTTNLGLKQAIDRVNKIKTLFTKKKITDAYGNITNMNAPLTTEEDIYFPTKKGVNEDVKVLEGSSSNNEISDIKYFQDKLRKCFKVAQSVGSDVSGSRNAIAELDTSTVRFIKTHIQNQVRKTLEWIYTRELELHGISNENILHIEMPEIASVNELRKWDIERIRAEITKIHSDAGVVSNSWLQNNVFYMTEAEKQLDMMEKEKEFKIKLEHLEKTTEAETPDVPEPEVGEPKDPAVPETPNGGGTIRVKSSYTNKKDKTKSNSYTTPKGTE